MVLGEHVEQAGSLVTPDRLRFDFTHFSAMTAEELKKVEELVNQEIQAGLDVVTQEMSLDEAKKTGAMALFGEKYEMCIRDREYGVSVMAVNCEQLKTEDINPVSYTHLMQRRSAGGCLRPVWQERQKKRRRNTFRMCL